MRAGTRPRTDFVMYFAYATLKEKMSGGVVVRMVQILAPSVLRMVVIRFGMSSRHLLWRTERRGASRDVRTTWRAGVVRPGNIALLSIDDIFQPILAALALFRRALLIVNLHW